ncbi:hypothetical protein [Parapedobacter luteus]|uniref:hypothetical protein n=1 Tax=Parapedobacter luteus TaxID=623280 RepID=UPI0011168302|nr:hypothetical protein [Parapedobacter luteus]
MKLLRVILLMYIGVLSLIPCRDDISALGFDGPLTHAASGHSDAHSHDSCSPFCVGNCCGAVWGLRMGIGPIKDPIYFPFTSDRAILYDIGLIPNWFLSKIWQPPQATV